ncbi:MAG TPA: response regulator transcription factor [Burkholderiales bacterium]|nr:response regulator transcription factor [Burkholderiaceae bacterium]HQR53398.1 response regulator transcription factor [Burkholderiales bacterium]
MQFRRLLHVEDHQVTALGLEHIVRSLVPDVEFRSVATIADALETMHQWKPDVIFLDLQLASETAVGHIGALRAASDGAAIAIFSAIDDITTMRLTVNRGASAFIQKGLPLDKQRAAIEKLLKNGYYFPPEIARADALDVPSDRKMGILKLLAAGKSNKSIARELGLSPDTVKTHVQQLFAMLGVENRTAAVREAQRRGLV